MLSLFRAFKQKFNTRGFSGMLGGSTSQEAYAFVFTCTKCETRSAKRIGKKAYHTGVVLVECPGCKNRHLVADNLKWFSEDKSNIETIMKEKGQTVFQGDIEIVNET